MPMSKEFIPMYNGNVDAILTGLTSKAAIYRVNGIMAAVITNKKTNTIVRKIEELQSDTSCLFGINVEPSISDFAIAALDILEVKKYNGSKTIIQKLIKSKMDFS